MNIMNTLKIALLSICFIFLSSNLTACGQKGPLIVEQPPVVPDEASENSENTDGSETQDQVSEDE